jgi:2-C-methyl-D-erythritol 4-phosphate cytidylyltransferase
MRTVAVVLAGGSGERFGTPVPKQLLPLAGRPMIEHSVAAFEQAPAVDQIMVVMAAGHAGQVRALLGTGGYAKLGQVIGGGPTRTGSTRCALAELGDDECDVLLHDAARPLVSQQTIADCVAALTKNLRRACLWNSSRDATHAPAQRSRRHSRSGLLGDLWPVVDVRA